MESHVIATLLIIVMFLPLCSAVAWKYWQQGERDLLFAFAVIPSVFVAFIAMLLLMGPA